MAWRHLTEVPQGRAVVLRSRIRLSCRDDFLDTTGCAVPYQHRENAVPADPGRHLQGSTGGSPPTPPFFGATGPGEPGCEMPLELEEVDGSWGKAFAFPVCWIRRGAKSLAASLDS